MTSLTSSGHRRKKVGFLASNTCWRKLIRTSLMPHINRLALFFFFNWPCSNVMHILLAWRSVERKVSYFQCVQLLMTGTRPLKMQAVCRPCSREEVKHDALKILEIQVPDMYKAYHTVNHRSRAKSRGGPSGTNATAAQ